MFPRPREASRPVGQGLTLLFTLFSELILVLGGPRLTADGPLRRSSVAARQVGLLALASAGFLSLHSLEWHGSGVLQPDAGPPPVLGCPDLPLAWLAERIVSRLPGVRAVGPALIGVGLGVIFASQVGATVLLIGGGTSLNLSAGGEDYERQYMTPAELAGANWVENRGATAIIQTDRYGSLRLEAVSGRGGLSSVVPQTIDRYAWVYGTRTNVVLGRARGEVGNISAIFTWPAAFLSNNFDTVYDDGDSRVYHR